MSDTLTLRKKKRKEKKRAFHSQSPLMGESCPQTRNQLAKVFRRRTRACTHKGSRSPANARGQFSVYIYRDSLVHTRLPSEYFNFLKISLVWLSPQPASQPAGQLLPARRVSWGDRSM